MNCTRANRRPVTAANERAISVLARPGLSSISTCPSASSPRRMSSSASRLPTTARSTSSRIRAVRSPSSAAEEKLRAPPGCRAPPPARAGRRRGRGGQAAADGPDERAPTPRGPNSRRASSWSRLSCTPRRARRASAISDSNGRSWRVRRQAALAPTVRRSARSGAADSGATCSVVEPVAAAGAARRAAAAASAATLITVAITPTVTKTASSVTGSNSRVALEPSHDAIRAGAGVRVGSPRRCASRHVRTAAAVIVLTALVCVVAAAGDEPIRKQAGAATCRAAASSSRSA